MMKLYGTPLCPDCVAAVKELDKKGIPYEYHDITGSTAELKAFLAIRDKEPLFDAVRAAGGIGIPCFVKEDGTVTLETADVLQRLILNISGSSQPEVFGCELFCCNKGFACNISADAAFLYA